MSPGLYNICRVLISAESKGPASIEYGKMSFVV